MLEETNVMVTAKPSNDNHSTHSHSTLQSNLNDHSDPWTAHCYHLLSPLTPTFSFLLQSTSTCSNCGNQCISSQSVTSLSLPLPIHNSMILSVILYPPLLLTATHVLAMAPQQFSLQVRKNITVEEFQELLHQVDGLHFPSSFYFIQTSASNSLNTQDWVHGQLVEGKNLICRICPPFMTNKVDRSWFGETANDLQMDIQNEYEYEREREREKDVYQENEDEDEDDKHQNDNKGNDNDDNDDNENSVHHGEDEEQKMNCRN